jgi:hypothetical protein
MSLCKPHFQICTFSNYHISQSFQITTLPILQISPTFVCCYPVASLQDKGRKVRATQRILLPNGKVIVLLQSTESATENNYQPAG